jgi:hypothetical protein
MTMKKSLAAIFAVSSMFFVNETAASAGTLDSGKGWSITWTHVGHPGSAAMIAACPTDGWIFALNNDGSLWLSTDSGADGTWVVQQAGGWHLPSDSSMACTIGNGSTTWDVLWFFVRSQNFLWSNVVNGTGGGWVLYGATPNITSIGGDYPLWTVRHDNGIQSYGSTGWVSHGSVSNVSRLAGWANTKNFLLETNGFFLFADNASDLGSANWQFVPMGGTGNPAAGTVVDMSVVWATTTQYKIYVFDSNADLWSGVIAETACHDLIDNDNNGFTDSVYGDADPACAGK